LREKLAEVDVGSEDNYIEFHAVVQACVASRIVASIAKPYGGHR
jgi:hypothetical protein